MHPAIITLLRVLLEQRYIGKKHTPERKLIKKLTRHITDKRVFDKDYKSIQDCLIKTKKRTGKDYDWHISLNPRKLKEVNEIIENG